MKIIAVEEHFSTQTYVDYLRSREEPPKWEIIEDEDHGKIERSWHHSFFRDRPLSWGLKLIDFEKRLQNMEETGIAMQVLSLTLPGVELFSNEDGKTMAKKTNDELATIISTYPGKFAGYAAIPCQSPLDAAAELERSVKDLGFVGATINSNVNGEYLDEKKYWVILEKAVELDVPVYLHTRELPADMVKPYTAYPCLLGAMFAFGQEASLHAMRLICSGVFDIYPKLKIILGHLGEALPFWQWRIDNHWSQIPFKNKPRRKPSEYLKDNFLITTSGMFWDTAFKCAYDVLGADNILFAVDYPYDVNEPAAQFIKSVQIPDQDREKICHLNAEKWLHL